LIQICDYLKGKGYEAALIKNFPEIPMMSNEEKVRSWSGAARFCVMIDREPSGHISEYEILKQQRCILAFLHPKDSGSTYMVGDAPLVDINYIKNFTFKHSPLEIMDESIKWAEELVKIREDVYNERYPWRKRGSNSM
jgi:hypothetical protein